MTVDLVDQEGRTYEVRSAGPVDGPVVLFFHGTPSLGLPPRVLLEPLVDRGVRVLSLSRPGYGMSTRNEGRSVSSVGSDIEIAMRRLGVDRFVACGWSGGGPHALATAARLPDGCGGVVLISGVGPFGMDGLDFFDGMNAENVGEFTVATTGEVALRSVAEAAGPILRGLTGDALRAAGLAGAAIPDSFADDVAGGIVDAVSGSYDGWIDDDLAFVQPWGFDIEAVTCPVRLHHGDADAHVPIAHARYLARRLPASCLTEVAGVDHGSLIPVQLELLLQDFADLLQV